MSLIDRDKICELVEAAYKEGWDDGLDCPMNGGLNPTDGGLNPDYEKQQDWSFSAARKNLKKELDD